EIHKEYYCIEKKVKNKIQQYYKALSNDGTLCDVLYYFHVKYLNCPECQKEISLFKSRIFSKHAVPKKNSSARSLCPNCNAINHVRFDATLTLCDVCSKQYNPQQGNVRGSLVSCPHCNTVFKLIDFMKGVATPLETKVYAKILLTLDGEKKYEPVNDFDQIILDKVSEQFALIKDEFPTVHIKPGYNTNQIIKHGYSHWLDMFSKRQLLSIQLFIQAINEIEDIKLQRLFACFFSGVLEFNNLFCSFKGEGTGAVRHIFSHHILKPELMPLEANIWGTEKSSGSFSTLYKSRLLTAMKYKKSPTELQISCGKSSKIDNINNPIQADISDTYAKFLSSESSVYLSQGDSSTFDIPDKSVDMIITDPPFFDNVHYSQLADFFYYWLNQLLHISNATTTRNAGEVQDTDAVLFAKKLTTVFHECNRVLHDNGLFIFTYHHSRHEGWVAVHEAIRRAGFVCVQTFPVKAEMSVSIPLQQAKTPVHLDLIIVCKKQQQAATLLKEQSIIDNAFVTASQQIRELADYIKISLGDAKVALMGRLLCELSMVGNVEKEVSFLAQSEGTVDTLLKKIIQEKTAEDKTDSHYVQLQLFEKSGN
ncbi:hypothetical protein VU04_03185, partial [Desulfobulbus sp. TB]|nr:hypothetical protein [Desulfobulbus sp. TB]